MTPRVSVVIPAYNGGQDLLECLASVAASALRPAAVLLVDNSSSDGSVEHAGRRFPGVEVVRNAENRGFGAACNQGIERALQGGCEFVLLLNQDASLERDTLASMIGWAGANPKAAVVGAKTLSPVLAGDGSPILLYNGSWATRLPLWQRIPDIGRSSRRVSCEPREVDYVWGHGMLLRCSALREVGVFDPGFFMYFEDLDLCCRMRAAGWQVWCDSRAVMWHAVDDGARAVRSERWRWRMKVESARYFYRKYFRGMRGDLLWGMTTFREAFSLLRNGHVVAAGDLVRAWCDELTSPSSAKNGG